MQMEQNNPYTAPASELRNAAADEYGTIKLFSISGRLGRLRYLAFITALILISWLGGSVLMAIIAALLAAVGKDAVAIVLPISMVLIYGTMLVGSFMLAIQRAHDFDTTGWITLLFLLPVINVIFSFILLFLPGTDGENRFGKKTPPNGTGVKIMAILIPISFVVIIGIMAAIAIPQYQQYKIKAQEAAQSK